MSFNPFSVLTSKIFGCLSIALALALGVQTLRLHSAQNHVARLNAEIAAIMSAQDAAKLKAEAARKQTETTYQEIARHADERAAQAYANGRDAASEYARTHRVPARTCGPSSGTVAPAVPDPSGDHNELGPDAVLLSREDFDRLNANTLRLQQVHEWGERLMDEGLAMPAPEFGG
jgi:hypothetical protein